MHKKRIVVTGMGIVSCFGNDVDLFYDQLLAGKSGVHLITHFPCVDYPTQFAAGVPEFDASAYVDRKQDRRIDPFIRFATVAGKKALEMGQVSPEVLNRLDKSRCGIVIGSGMGGLRTFYEGTVALSEKGVRRLTPFFIPYIITNMAGALLAIDLGFMGPNYSISTACATANYSIVAAANHIRQGHADVMLCGGSEAAVHPIGLAGFIANKTLSERNEEPERASCPWSRRRDGFVMGEGSGVLLLESLEHAQKRGAPILCEYLGGSVGCDAFHITAPREDGHGVAQCIANALHDAGASMGDVNYINAHATSTPQGDMAEVEAIHKVFGPHTKHLKMNATKSLVGHCLGAAGGIEAIATIMAIRTGKIHPTLNLIDPEPGLGDIDPVADVMQELSIKIALSNSFGFGGHNSTIVFAPFQEYSSIKF
jgi:3-oxoacyl-[acyl-carrier-protein] synthase II